MIGDASIIEIERIIRRYLKDNKLSKEEFFDRLDLSSQDIEKYIPLSIFSQLKYGILEIIVKYLKENRNKRYSEIAELLNRDQRTIWTTYNKMKNVKRIVETDSLLIPLKIFQNRDQGPLTALCSFLRNEEKLSYVDISKLLNRNYRTIWTVVNKK